MIDILSLIFNLIEILVFIYAIYFILKVAKIIQRDIPDDEKVKQLKKLLIRKDKR